MIEAAKAAGVTRIAYTGVLRADTTELTLAAEHKATETVLRESGIAFTLLRNGRYIENYTGRLGRYIENYTGRLGRYLERGEILGAAGNGRVAAATRADYAAADAVRAAKS